MIFESFSFSTYLTKMTIKWTKINLQTSFRPIWNPENQGYKIGYEKSFQGQELSLKNGLEKSVRLLFADSVRTEFIMFFTEPYLYLQKII